MIKPSKHTDRSPEGDAIRAAAVAAGAAAQTRRREGATPQEITVWVCPECGYWRKEQTTGLHQTTDTDNPRGMMVSHELTPVVYTPKEGQ